MIFNNVILLNMFALIFIQQFEELYENPFHPLFILKDFLGKFRNAYNECITKTRKNNINIQNIIKFIRCLPDFKGSFF